MLEVRNLTRRFGAITAVDDISFSLVPGEVLGFLGPNGAGKSTTMKMVTGFLPPTRGSVRVAGYDVRRSPTEVKRRIGYLPEGAAAYQDISPAGFLEFVAEIRGLRGADKRRRIQRAIELVHLEPVLHQPIETLSKGFKRRVGFAQAIVHDPPVLIMDEPTDGLDPNQKHEVRELIRTMAGEKVIILSTHILEEVEAVCNRAMVIAAGRIVADTTPGDLEARSALHNAVTVTLVGADPEQAQEMLGQISQVKRVERLDAPEGQLRLRLYPSQHKPFVNQVSVTAQQQGWEISELLVERGRLDEVFRDITLPLSKAS
ncbi:MAG TPA: ABC transporter ATP-binding protein [Gammaproteobacteria bacterium]|nr:ABC transporter ATP-binding protein [Gammaproteobacteria bacterium]